MLQSQIKRLWEVKQMKRRYFYLIKEEGIWKVDELAVPEYSTLLSITLNNSSGLHLMSFWKGKI